MRTVHIHRKIEVMEHHQLDNRSVCRVFYAINNNLYNLFKEIETEIEWVRTIIVCLQFISKKKHTLTHTTQTHQAICNKFICWNNRMQNQLKRMDFGTLIKLWLKSAMERKFIEPNEEKERKSDLNAFS